MAQTTPTKLPPVSDKAPGFGPPTEITTVTSTQTTVTSTQTTVASTTAASTTKASTSRQQTTATGPATSPTLPVTSPTVPTTTVKSTTKITKTTTKPKLSTTKSTPSGPPTTSTLTSKSGLPKVTDQRPGFNPASTAPSSPSSSFSSLPLSSTSQPVDISSKDLQKGSLTPGVIAASVGGAALLVLSLGFLLYFYWRGKHAKASAIKRHTFSFSDITDDKHPKKKSNGKIDGHLQRRISRSVSINNPGKNLGEALKPEAYSNMFLFQPRPGSSAAKLINNRGNFETMPATLSSEYRKEVLLDQPATWGGRKTSTSASGFRNVVGNNLSSFDNPSFRRSNLSIGNPEDYNYYYGSFRIPTTEL